MLLVLGSPYLLPFSFILFSPLTYSHQSKLPGDLLSSLQPHARPFLRRRAARLPL